jgi:flagellar motor switch protein FliM
MTDSIGNVTNLSAPEVAQTHARAIPASQPFFRAVEKWDGRSASGMPQETLAAVTNPHRPLARGLARSLGVYLRASVEVEPSEAYEAAYDQLENVLAPGSLTIASKLELQASPVIVLVDAAITSTCLDLLLGGSGEKPLERVELTDVDVQILSELSRMLSHELQIAWQDFDLRLHAEVSTGKIARRMIPQAGRVLILTFKIKLGESTGNLNLLLPPSVVESMLDRVNISLISDRSDSKAPVSREFGNALTDITVPMELVLPAMRIPIRELLQLSENSVLTLPLRANQPAQLVVAGRELFSAIPARSGTWRAAKIEKAIVNTVDDSGRTDLQ